MDLNTAARDLGAVALEHYAYDRDALDPSKFYLYQARNGHGACATAQAGAEQRATWSGSISVGGALGG